MVHDPVSRTIVTAKKEEILLEIERQWDLGDDGLLEEDKYLVEVNMGDIETMRLLYGNVITTGYWPLKLCGRLNYFGSNRSDNRQ
jgi:hypothetical protein